MSLAEPILPQQGKRNVLITSALPYVNNVPHLGNIIGSVLSADVFARYCRARGYQTLYVCGSDEYGTATETKALEEGVDPEALCAKYNALHAEVYSWFRIKFDVFGRTTIPQQTEIVQDIFRKLWDNGYILEQETIQPFCPLESHGRFLADRFIEGECSLCHYPDARGDQCDKCGKPLDPLEPEGELGADQSDAAVDDPTLRATGWLINPRCKVDGTAPERRSTKHLFIRLDVLSDEINAWYKDASKEGAWSANCQNITKSWIEKGLKPRAISRDLSWGVPIPLDTKGIDAETYKTKCFYVWFDATIGYVSITKSYTDGDDMDGKKWEQWWKNPENVTLYQFMGKDNVPYHSVLFPGSLLGTKENWTKVSKLSTSEYLNYEGGKFSKSRNVGVFGHNAKDTGIDPDVWRCFLLSRRPETSDSEFKWQEFVDVNNNELLKNLGNLNQRVLKFCATKMDGVVPDYTKYTDDAIEAYKVEIDGLLQNYIQHLEMQKLRAGLADIFHISAAGNKLLADNKVDSTLFAEQPDKCAAVVGIIINTLSLIAGIAAPYLPGTSEIMLKQLGLEPVPFIPDKFDATAIKPAHTIGTPAHLFHIIKPEKVQEWQKAYGGDELQKQKELVAAAKKARKEKEKEKKQKKAATAATGGQGVESLEKKEMADPAIEKVTEALENTEVHTS